MELTPEEIADKTHGFWDHYYMYTRDWPAEKVIEEIAKMIREYGEQQYEKGKDDTYSKLNERDF